MSQNFQTQHTCHCVDLHTHTTASDGTLAPAELVRHAVELQQQGLPLVAVALTDHDTTAGLDEAIETGKALGFEVIPGVELSTWMTISEGKGCEVHVLGYYMDYGNPGFQEQLATLRKGRHDRNRKLLERLREMGIDLSMEDLQASGPSAGRAHVARLLIEAGHAVSVDDAFKRFLGAGGTAYCPRSQWEPERAIRLISDYGGIAVLAHPRYIELSEIALERWLCTWKNFGLRGVEACYAANSPWETEQYSKLARRKELLITGGTDFHGANKPRIALGTGNGNFCLPSTYLCKLKKAAGCLRRD